MKDFNTLNQETVVDDLLKVLFFFLGFALLGEVMSQFHEYMIAPAINNQGNLLALTPSIYVLISFLKKSIGK